MASLKMTARLSRKYITPEQNHTLYLLIDLEAAEKQAAGERLPVNLGFVIDRSGSMRGAKLDTTKQAVQFAVSHFTPQDIASLTVYDDEVQVLYPAKPVKYKDELKGIVSRIFPGGMTNLSGGMTAGYQEVARNARPDQVNRVLLLTDGLANRGITEPKRLCNKAAGMKKAGVTLTTLGVGDDFDEDLLTQMAEESGGNYYFIDSAEQIPQIFAQELQSLLSVAAQNVKLRYYCGEAVEVRKVWNYRPSGDRTLEIALPDIYSADRKVLLLELSVRAGGLGTLPLGSVELSYADAGEGLETVCCTLDLTAECTRNPELTEAPEETEVIVQLELNRTAEAREQAIRLADEGDFGAASVLLKTSYHSLSSLQGLDASAEKDLEAEMLNVCEAAGLLENHQYNPNLRKKMAYQSYQRRNNRK